jgi:hypothetical protein
LAQAQRSLGYDAEAVCRPTGLFQFPVDREFPSGNPVGLARLVWQFDVFHFYFGESLSGPNLIDVPWLKQIGKRVFFHFCGCDIRDSKQTIAQYATSACAECWPQLCSENREAAREAALRYADGIFVSTPDLLEFVPGAELLLQPVDVPQLTLLANAAREKARSIKGGRNRPLRIAHGPSNRQIKGTRYVIEAVESLRSQGLDVELILIEKMAHADAMALCATCDLAVDQLLVGAYGQFAVETMMLGLPTICYLRDDVVRHYPADCPLIHATRETLSDCIAQLYDLRRSVSSQDEHIAQAGRDYVCKCHDAMVTAQQCIDAYTAGNALRGVPNKATHIAKEGVFHEASV